MKIKTAILLTIFILVSRHISAQTVDLSGYVRNYSGVLMGNGSTDFVILQNTFNLNFEKKFTHSALKVNPMIYHDNSDSITFRLREAYIDLIYNNFDLRIGKQQIVWGKADGVFITDIVSPKNLFQFLLPDFDEIREGVVGVKADYYFGENTLEAVWLPVFTPTILPNTNSLWSPKMTSAMPVLFDNFNLRVTPSLKNSELYLKYSTLTSVADFEIMAGYMWDDDPAMFYDLRPAGLGGITPIISPEHKRLSLVGGSFSTILGPFVLRGEGAYYYGKYFSTSNPSINNGTIVKDYIHAMFGFDVTLFEVNLSTQFINKVILDYETVIQPNALINDKYNSMMTFMARYSMLNETLSLELFSYYDFEYDDAFIRPKLLYDYTDTINLQIGANIFTGTAGQFGQFNKNDMVYSKLIYNF